MNPSRIPIRSVAVLGAGTMGAQIAAHVANAGFPVLLLDVSPQAAREGLQRARKLKPDPFFTGDSVARIRTGGFDEHLAGIRLKGRDNMQCAERWRIDRRSETRSSFRMRRARLL